MWTAPKKLRHLAKNRNQGRAKQSKSKPKLQLCKERLHAHIEGGKGQGGKEESSRAGAGRGLDDAVEQQKDAKCNAHGSLQAGVAWLRCIEHSSHSKFCIEGEGPEGSGEGQGRQIECPPVHINVFSPWWMLTMQGAGGFGSVYAAKWRDKDVAVKRLSPSIGQDTEQYKALVREVELSSKFNSERLVRVYGACLKVRCPLC